MTSELVCEGCGKTFTGRATTRFCGYPCRRRASRPTPDPRVCPRCQTPFTPAHAAQTYCTPACRKKTSTKAKPTGPAQKSTKRYPLAPLLELMGGTETAAMDELGIGGDRARYKREGLTEKMADRLSQRAGFHAAVVWPEITDDWIAASQVKCAGCPTLFIPARSTQKFCNDRCRKRHNRRLANGYYEARAKPRLCKCGRPFYPTWALQTWCKKGCQANYLQAQRRRTDPDYREQLRLYSRNYYAAYRSHLAAQQARRDRTKAERNKMTTITPEYVTTRFETELGPIPHLALAPFSEAAWAGLDAAIGPRDRAIGLHVEVGDQVPAGAGDPEDGDDPTPEFQVLVFYSPERIARTAEALPMSPAPSSDELFVALDSPVPEPQPNGLPNDVACILFADNYVRLLIQEILTVVAHAGENIDARRDAVDQAIIGLHPTANRLATLVQFEALEASS